MSERDKITADVLDIRGVQDACEDCGGFGVKVYPNTATWRGGIGGNALTNDVCDKCWGSGDQSRPWPSHRRAEKAEAALASCEAAALERAAMLADEKAQARRSIEHDARRKELYDIASRNAAAASACELVAAEIRSLIPAGASPSDVERLKAENARLREVIVTLSGHLDDYWNGDRSDVTVKAIRAAQQECRRALASQEPQP